ALSAAPAPRLRSAGPRDGSRASTASALSIGPMPIETPQPRCCLARSAPASSVLSGAGANERDPSHDPLLSELTASTATVRLLAFRAVVREAWWVALVAAGNPPPAARAGPTHLAVHRDRRALLESGQHQGPRCQVQLAERCVIECAGL